MNETQRKLFPVDDLDMIITDTQAPEDMVDLMRKRGVEVMLV